MQHIIGYVTATREYHTGSDFILAGASEASLPADRIPRKSRSGLLIFGCLMPAYWSSHRQTSITLSSMEAETTALTHCSKHIALTHFFNKEHIKSGEIAPVYIPTEPELADVLTKNPTAMFDEQIKQLLGLVPKDNFTKYLKDHQTSYDKLQSRRARAVE
jgi:hypothetical protein